MTRFLTRKCLAVLGPLGDQAMEDGPGPASALIWGGRRR